VADAKRLRVIARLLFGFQRINAFPLGFNHGNGLVICVQQKVINEAVPDFLEIVAEISVGRVSFLEMRDSQMMLSGPFLSGKKRQPACSRGG
jgi:hypothetical protein